MDALPSQQQPTGDFFDLSDDEALPHDDPSRPTDYGGGIVSPDMSHVTGIDRNEYSDEDIRIVYEIVIRAETILADELTPSSRLPTHALFLAYDEILADYHMDPNERHISKLVFMVGGVKGDKSLMDKFKAVMTRMNITLDIEDTRGFATDRENGVPDDGLINGDGGDRRALNDQHMTDAPDEFPQTNGYKPNGHIPGPSTELPDAAKEQDLAEKAEFFRQRRHAPYSVVATFRTWHSAAHYVDYVCAQSDAARDADLMDTACDIFHAWRAISAKAKQADPRDALPNTYSKRTEKVANRAHEIWSTKKALARWRQLARVAQYQKQLARDAELMADRLAAQAIDEDDFKEDPQLARLAKATHQNLVMSRALAAWSNRVEEMAGIAEIAAKARDMNLKLKAFGLSRVSPAVGTMQTAPPDVKPPNMPSPSVAQPSILAPTPFRPPPSADQSVLASIAPTPSQPKTSTESPSDLSAARPSSVIPTTAAPSGPMAIPTAAPAEPAVSAAPTVEPVPPSKPAEAVDDSEEEEYDEQTMIARRHILRMRYFGAWQKYTGGHVARVKQFREEGEDEQAVLSVSTWRDQAASKRQQISECEAGFEEIKSYKRMAAILPKWREKVTGEEHNRDQELDDFARQIEFHHRSIKLLPILREKTQQAEEKEQTLRLYAARSNYYTRATQALTVWSQRAQEASKNLQLQQETGVSASHYYKTRKTLCAWRHRAKQRRKERLKEAHLETRRIVKKSMGERCIKQWREKLEPSYSRYEVMNVALANAIEDRGLKQMSENFTAWRQQAQERAEAHIMSDDILKQKAVEQWRTMAAVHREMEPEAKEHWENKSMARALRTWNLSSLQSTNRPEMVTNATEKKERKLLRQGFETWYGHTANKLVPVELPDGSFKNVGQVVKDARRQAVQNHARGLLGTWRMAAAAVASNTVMQTVPEEVYAPTPGRPHLLLGSFGSRETTTPLAPVPSYARFQARDSTMGKSEYGARPGRAIVGARNAKNLRVSWAP